MSVNIGKIVKAQGIKGEIKVSCLLDKPEDILQIKEITCAGKTYKVLYSRAIMPIFAILSLEGVVDRNGAEALVGKDIYAKKEALNLPHGRYLIDDLIGCEVYVADACVGTVTQLSPCPSADIIFCEGEKNVSFPFLKDLIKSVDIENKKITLDEKRFYEVCLYED